MTLLSVNLNKIAVLRNARGGGHPDLAKAARTCIQAGCAGITVHPRPDLRHIRPDDVKLLGRLTKEHGVEFNIEGNPFAPPRDGYPGLLTLVETARPTQVTLVPDDEGQLTSDHGFDLTRDTSRLRQAIESLRQHHARVSLFVNAGAVALASAAKMGAQRVEIYTGPYAEAFEQGDCASELETCADTARQARAAGLAVNAGHDLNQRNLGTLRQAIPQLAEVSIGHALIGEALYAGLADTVRAYLEILA